MADIIVGQSVVNKHGKVGRIISFADNVIQTVLEEFCSLPISSSEEVFKRFEKLPGAIAHYDGEKRNFVYVPGKRRDRVLLVAHADTVWDYFYTSKEFDQSLICEKGIYSGTNSECGIGADDRAGCAILYCLKDSGHSLLIVDGEERGQIGSKHIKDAYPEIYDELNSHSYMLQLDRRGFNDYKVYDLPVSRGFVKFISRTTGYIDAGKNARTDIVVLCRDICGANLSIGYYNEHTPYEKLSFDDWFRTLEITERILTREQKKYYLKKGLFSRWFR